MRESKSQVYMRGIVEMKLTYLELVDAMLYFGIEIERGKRQRKGERERERG